MPAASFKAEPSKTPLQQLAQRLHRPPVSLNGMTHLSDGELNWLLHQIDQMEADEDQLIKQHLQHKMPLFLRWVILKRLRVPS
jgi:hypothetical protein